MQNSANLMIVRDARDESVAQFCGCTDFVHCAYMYISSIMWELNVKNV